MINRFATLSSRLAVMLAVLFTVTACGGGGGSGGFIPDDGSDSETYFLSLIHISEPTRPRRQSRMPSSA